MQKTQRSVTVGLKAARGLVDLVPWATKTRGQHQTVLQVNTRALLQTDEKRKQRQQKSHYLKRKRYG